MKTFVSVVVSAGAAVAAPLSVLQSQPIVNVANVANPALGVSQLINPLSLANFGCAGYMSLNGLANTCGSVASAYGLSVPQLVDLNPGIISCADTTSLLAAPQSLCVQAYTPTLLANGYSNVNNFGLLAIAPGAPFDNSFVMRNADLLSVGRSLASPFGMASFALRDNRLFANPYFSTIANVAAINPLSNIAGVSNIAGISPISNIAGVSNIAGIAPVSNIAAINPLSNLAVTPALGYNQLYQNQLYPTLGYNQLYQNQLYPTLGYNQLYQNQFMPNMGYSQLVQNQLYPSWAQSQVIAPQLYNNLAYNNLGYNNLATDIAPIAGVSNIAGLSPLAGVANVAGLSPLAGVANVAGINNLAQVQSIAANPGAIQVATNANVAALGTSALPVSILPSSIFGISNAVSPINAVTGLSSYGLTNGFLTLNNLEAGRVCATTLNGLADYQLLWGAEAACAGQMYDARFMMVPMTGFGYY